MSSPAVNQTWEPVAGRVRPSVLYHAVRRGAAKPETVAKKLDGVLRRGLTPHTSRHRIAGRDSQALLFLFADPLSAELYSAGGHVLEVSLPPDAPLFYDPPLRNVGALFTTVPVTADRLRLLAPDELVSLSRKRPATIR